MVVVNSNVYHKSIFDLGIDVLNHQLLKLYSPRSRIYPHASHADHSRAARSCQRLETTLWHVHCLARLPHPHPMSSPLPSGQTSDAQNQAQHSLVRAIHLRAGKNHCPSRKLQKQLPCCLKRKQLHSCCFKGLWTQSYNRRPALLLPKGPEGRSRQRCPLPHWGACSCPCHSQASSCCWVGVQLCRRGRRGVESDGMKLGPRIVANSEALVHYVRDHSRPLSPPLGLGPTIGIRSWSAQIL